MHSIYDEPLDDGSQRPRWVKRKKGAFPPVITPEEWKRRALWARSQAALRQAREREERERLERKEAEREKGKE